MKPDHWHVLGAGAIGCVFACALQRAGSTVTLLLRPGTRETSVPVQIDNKSGSIIVHLPVSTALERGRISHLLVTTKAQDVREAVQSVAHRVEPDSQILLLVNGWGFADELRATLPEPDYYFGTTTEGAYRIGPRHVCHAGRGLTRVGRIGVASPPTWFGRWSQALPPTLWDQHIDQALWLKLAINCAINPLTALHNCRNGDLARPEFAGQLHLLCKEIMRISEATGYAGITADLYKQVTEVIHATAENRSSMLQDFLAGRTTEIDYITGHLLRAGKRHGIAAPHNEALLRKLTGRDG